MNFTKLFLVLILVIFLIDFEKALVFGTNDTDTKGRGLLTEEDESVSRTLSKKKHHHRRHHHHKRGLLTEEDESVSRTLNKKKKHHHHHHHHHHKGGRLLKQEYECECEKESYPSSCTVIGFDAQNEVDCWNECYDRDPSYNYAGFDSNSGTCCCSNSDDTIDANGGVHFCWLIE